MLKNLETGIIGNYLAGLETIDNLIKSNTIESMTVCVAAMADNGKKIVLHADHIKPFAFFPKLRFAIDNGRTLCIDCHKKTDTYKKQKL